MDNPYDVEAEMAPLCRECVERMKPWPGNLYVCWNADCSEAGNPVEVEGEDSQADGSLYSSDRMASVMREGR